MRTTKLLMPYLVLSFIFFAHCQGATPSEFAPSSDEDIGESTDPVIPTDTDKYSTDSDSTTLTDTNTDTHLDTETDTINDSDSVSDTGLDTGSDTGTDTGSDTDTDTDTGSDTGTDTGSDTETDEETDSADSTPWWECNYPERREIDIDGAPHIEPRIALSLVFDHKSLVANDLSKPDGSDIRILHWNGTSYNELPRAVDPISNWNLEDTKIWFSFQSSAFSATGSEKIYLYHGHLQALNPPDEENKVFHFADFFERQNSSNLGSQWEEFSIPGTDVELKDGAMCFQKTDDATNSPGADGRFDPISTKFALRLGFDWSLAYSQERYRVHIQLGSQSQMEQPPSQQEWDWFSNGGAGPSLLWSGEKMGMENEQGFGYEVAGVVSEVAMIDGEASIQAEVDASSQTYSLSIDGGAPTVNIPFTSSINAIDNLRIFTWSVATSTTSTHSFQYVIINKIGPLHPVAHLTTDSTPQHYDDWCI